MKQMNLLAAAVLVLALSACGSKTKKEETATPTTPAATTPATSSGSEKPADQKMTNKSKKSTIDLDAKEIKCMSGSDERTLANTAKDSGCELIYTKGGEAKTIATQIIGDAKCVEVMGKVRANLENAGFKCQ